MGLYLNSGNAAFELYRNDEIYVDKSSIIEKLNDRIGKSNRFVCVSRPRRFGKSMTAAMIAAYYDKSANSDYLFNGLDIAKSDSYNKNMNHYDVIFINIQKFLRKAENIEAVAECIEQEVCREVIQQYGEELDLPAKNLPDVLETIYYSREDKADGFIFVIDEWDCIFREAKDNEAAQKKYLDFLRDLFKDRVYVRLAYMTGILPVKKYGTHSALNIFEELSMVNSSCWAEYVGFTAQEVESLCDRYRMDYETMQWWYDGYLLGDGLSIYNPKSVVDCLSKKKYSSYWTVTETYEALQLYIDLDFDGLKQAIIYMLGGNKIQVDTGTFQNDMTTFCTKDDILTLLVHLGYLGYDESSLSVFIPNEEVRLEFLRAIRNGSRPRLIDEIKKSQMLLDATWSLDGDAVAQTVEEFHEKYSAPQFYNNEQALRNVILISYLSAVDYYTTIQELPSGKGYADIVYIPNKGIDRPALIVELKWNKPANSAIDQIKDKNYPQAIKDWGKEVILVGISYDEKSKKHSCVVERM